MLFGDFLLYKTCSLFYIPASNDMTFSIQITIIAPCFILQL